MKWVIIVVASLVGLIAVIAIAGYLVPRDHRATSTILLRQPLDSVWRVVRDIGGITSWWPQMKESTRMPDQDGREVWRQKMSGFDVPLVVLESQSPGRLVTKIDASAGAPFGGTWTYELTPDSGGGGTRISVREDGWISNPVFRFLSRFVFGYYGSLDGYLKALGKRFGEAVKPTHS
jgi:uncharacterized protein YndB with AHSA1/START domain